jgi:hypothetical protein
MPSRPAYVWPIRISFTLFGLKPRRARLPGLAIVARGRYPNGTYVWGCCLEGLYAN